MILNLQMNPCIIRLSVYLLVCVMKVEKKEKLERKESFLNYINSISYINTVLKELKGMILNLQMNPCIVRLGRQRFQGSVVSDRGEYSPPLQTGQILSIYLSIYL